MPRIRKFEQLEELNRQRAVLKFSQDGGQSWSYAKLNGRPRDAFENASSGYGAVCEVRNGVHSTTAFVDHDFLSYGRGGPKTPRLIMTTTPAEVAGKVWSYE